MATLDAAAIELAESLPIDAVPAKLRCGSCNKLAINAVKLPCCDQSICEPCSLDLPESCPICGHSPLSAEDCKPNKSLRMTAKAFIKSEEKKRSKESETPVTQVAVNLAATASETPAPLPDSSVTETGLSASGANGVIHDSFRPLGDGSEAAIDVVISPAQRHGTDDETRQDAALADTADQDDDEDDEDDDVVITTERPEQEAAAEPEGETSGQGPPYGQQTNQMPMGGSQGFGFDPSQQGFGNMDFGGMNFNPMMGMPNGMGMGNFPMGMPDMLGGGMGMPGMNMDPSMLFGGGGGNGFGGMSMADMNMMNMAMGMSGLGGFGGGMTGMGMNDPQAGFFPGQGGYNHPNFGNQMNPSFHNRGYGRPYGRGGYGRGRGGYGFNRGGGRGGGWSNQHQGQAPYMNHQNHHAPMGSNEGMNGDTPASGRRASPSYEPMKSADGSINTSNVTRGPANTEHGTNETGGEINDLSRQASAADGQPIDGDGDGNHESDRNGARASYIPTTMGTDSAALDQLPDTIGHKDTTDERSADMMPDQDHGQTPAHFNANGTSNEDTQDQSYDQQYPEGINHPSQSRGGFNGGRGGFRGGRGSTAYGYVATISEPQQAQAVPPINAPTGPKAMRAGLPNSGIYSRPSIAVVNPAPTTPSHPPEGDSRRASLADAESIRQSDRPDAVQSKSRSRSRSRHRSRRHRYRSRSAEYEYESEETYERRRDRERRRRRDKERRHGYEGEGTSAEPSSAKDRSRSETPDDRNGRKSGHEHSSRRYRNRDRKRRHARSRSPDRNGKDDDRDEGRHKSRSDRRREGHHHSERERSRDRDRDRARHRPDSSRDDTKRSHESSRRSKESSSRDHRDREGEHTARKTPLEQPEDDIGFKIKGGSRRQIERTSATPTTSMGPPPPTGPRRPSRQDRRSSEQSMGRDHSPDTATANSAPLDSYAAERQAREQARLERHRSQLAQTSRSNSLGKRSGRDDDDEGGGGGGSGSGNGGGGGGMGDGIPTGPKGHSSSDGRGHGGHKKARAMSYRYEDDFGREEKGEARRWR